MPDYTDMKFHEPQDIQEILFKAKPGITQERIGIADPEFRLVIVKNTHLSFDDILYWIPIPEDLYQEDMD